MRNKWVFNRPVWFSLGVSIFNSILRVYRVTQTIEALFKSVLYRGYKGPIGKHEENKNMLNKPPFRELPGDPTKRNPTNRGF